MSCTTNHALMFFFLLSLLLVHTHDFFSSPSNPKTPKFTKPRNPPCSCNCPTATTPTITILLSFLSGVLFTIICIVTIKAPTFFTTPIRSAVQSALDFSTSCVRRIKRTPPSPETAAPSPATAGISASLLNTLPIFAYSDEKRPNFGKHAGLCAICLSEFLNEQTLRWLPDCDHLFHRRCVDTWLESHKTCPCCRANVERSPGGEILMLENGESAPQMRSASFRRDGSGRDLDDRRRVGCERSVVSGLIRVLLGRRRHHGSRTRHR